MSLHESGAGAAWFVEVRRETTACENGVCTFQHSVRRSPFFAQEQADDYIVVKDESSFRVDNTVTELGNLLCWDDTRQHETCCRFSFQSVMKRDAGIPENLYAIFH